MERRTVIALFVSVLLAIGVPLALAGKAQLDLKSGEVVRVKIAPYDPRDLLRGHYMRFQIAWNWAPAPAVESKDYIKPGNQCLCLGPESSNPTATLQKCDALPSGPSCTHVLKGHYNYQQWNSTHSFTTGIEKFYVDEKRALSLEQAFAKNKDSFSLGLVLRKNGKPVIEEMYVDGVPLPEYLKNNP